MLVFLHIHVPALHLSGIKMNKLLLLMVTIAKLASLFLLIQFNDGNDINPLTPRKFAENGNLKPLMPSSDCFGG